MSRPRLTDEVLTQTEDTLLHALEAARPQWAPPGLLALAVLGYDDRSARITLRRHICNLRRKVGRETITTNRRWGGGYRLVSS